MLILTFKITLNNKIYPKQVILTFWPPTIKKQPLPEIKELKEKFKDSKPEMNKEIKQFYIHYPVAELARMIKNYSFVRGTNLNIVNTLETLRNHHKLYNEGWSCLTESSKKIIANEVDEYLNNK